MPSHACVLFELSLFAMRVFRRPVVGKLFSIEHTASDYFGLSLVFQTFVALRDTAFAENVAGGRVVRFDFR